MILSYRNAGIDDVDMIFSQAKTLIDTYEDLASINYESVLAWVKRKIETNISQYTCVTVDGIKCAYFCLCPDGELDDFYVLPAFRNRGIGTEILKKCIAETKEKLYLYVFSGNNRAISLYIRHGFSVRELVGKTRLIMERKG